jgi:hypothetical protein
LNYWQIRWGQVNIFTFPAMIFRALKSFLPILLLSSILTQGGAKADVPIPNQTDVDKVAAMLPATPTGVGRPITDRESWDKAALQPAFQKEVADAQKFADEPIPELPDSLYHDIQKTGLRGSYETPARLRSTRLVAFVVAECIENRGNYLPLIEKELNAILGETSWAAPAHSLFGNPFGGIDRSIDLATSARAWTLATTDYWLGDKLKPETRQRIRDEIKRRVFIYYEEAVKTGQPHWWWMTGESNWNAVCNSGVVGAALALLPSPQDRALFILGAKNYLQYYLQSFPDEGYDFEGMSYWDYGFGCYLCLSETVYEATQGQLNLFEGAKLRQIALFPRHFEIMDGLFPAFGDSGVAKVKGIEKVASSALLLMVNERWGMGWTDLDPSKSNMFSTHPLGDRLFGFGIFGFPLPVYNGSIVTGSPPPTGQGAPSDLRCFFKEANVFISRSERPGQAHLGIALKGGDNGHSHGHDDNGTYVVACNGKALIVDPGMAVYTADVPGLRWGDCMMNNSFGHDVPYIGHTLEVHGKTALGKIVSTEFTDDKDTLVMDLTTSYNVPGLRKVTRTYVLDRTVPQIEITDEASFNHPVAFGTALITFSNWRAAGAGSYIITSLDGIAALKATVTVDEGSVVSEPVPFSGTRIPNHINAKRLGVNLSAPADHVVMHTLLVPTRPEG